MRHATRQEAAADGSPKTPTARLSRALLTLRGARAALRAVPLGLAAIAHNARRAPGYGSGSLMRHRAGGDGGINRSAPAGTRVLDVVLLLARPGDRPHPQSSRLQSPARASSHPQPPQGGFGRACEHNAQSIMRNPLNAALRAALNAGSPAIARIMCAMFDARAASEDARCKVRRSAALFNARPPAARRTFANNRCSLPLRRFAPCLVASLPVLRLWSRARAACSRRAAFAVCLMSVAPCSPCQGQVNGRRRPPLTRLRSMRVGPADSARRERWANRRSV
jgi:hypothetical protein